MEIREIFQAPSSEDSAYLLLVSPVYQGQKLDRLTLQILKESVYLAKQYTVLEQKQGAISLLALSFQSLSDAMDFYLEVKQHMTFVQVMMKSSLDQFFKLNIPQFQQMTMSEQLQLEGFQQNNGRLKLQRITSLDDMIYDSCHDQSTTIQTLQRLESVSDNDQQENQQKNQEQSIKQQIIIPLLQGILIVGFFYGFYRLANSF